MELNRSDLVVVKPIQKDLIEIEKIFLSDTEASNRGILSLSADGSLTILVWIKKKLLVKHVQDVSDALWQKCGRSELIVAFHNGSLQWFTLQQDAGLIKTLQISAKTLLAIISTRDTSIKSLKGLRTWCYTPQFILLQPQPDRLVILGTNAENRPTLRGVLCTPNVRSVIMRQSLIYVQPYRGSDLYIYDASSCKLNEIVNLVLKRPRVSTSVHWDSFTLSGCLSPVVAVVDSERRIFYSALEHKVYQEKKNGVKCFSLTLCQIIWPTEFVPTSFHRVCLSLSEKVLAVFGSAEVDSVESHFYFSCDLGNNEGGLTLLHKFNGQVSLLPGLYQDVPDLFLAENGICMLTTKDPVNTYKSTHFSVLLEAFKEALEEDDVDILSKIKVAIEEDFRKFLFSCNRFSGWMEELPKRIQKMTLYIDILLSHLSSRVVMGSFSDPVAQISLLAKKHLITHHVKTFCNDANNALQYVEYESISQQLLKLVEQLEFYLMGVEAIGLPEGERDDQLAAKSEVWDSKSLREILSDALDSGSVHLAQTYLSLKPWVYGPVDESIVISTCVDVARNADKKELLFSMLELYSGGLKEKLKSTIVLEEIELLTSVLESGRKLTPKESLAAHLVRATHRYAPEYIWKAPKFWSDIIEYENDPGTTEESPTLTIGLVLWWTKEALTMVLLDLYSRVSVEEVLRHPECDLTKLWKYLLIRQDERQLLRWIGYQFLGADQMEEFASKYHDSQILTGSGPSNYGLKFSKDGLQGSKTESKESGSAPSKYDQNLKGNDPQISKIDIQGMEPGSSTLTSNLTNDPRILKCDSDEMESGSSDCDTILTNDPQVSKFESSEIGPKLSSYDPNLTGIDPQKSKFDSQEIASSSSNFDHNLTDPQASRNGSGPSKYTSSDIHVLPPTPPSSTPKSYEDKYMNVLVKMKKEDSMMNPMYASDSDSLYSIDSSLLEVADVPKDPVTYDVYNVTDYPLKYFVVITQEMVDELHILHPISLIRNNLLNLLAKFGIFSSFEANEPGLLIKRLVVSRQGFQRFRNVCNPEAYGYKIDNSYVNQIVLSQYAKYDLPSPFWDYLNSEFCGLGELENLESENLWMDLLLPFIKLQENQDDQFIFELCKKNLQYVLKTKQKLDKDDYLAVLLTMLCTPNTSIKDFLHSSTHSSLQSSDSGRRSSNFEEDPYSISQSPLEDSNSICNSKSEVNEVLQIINTRSLSPIDVIKELSSNGMPFLQFLTQNQTTEAKMDVSVYDLLRDNISFDIGQLFYWQKQNRYGYSTDVTQPSFDDASLSATDGASCSLDYYYYLKKGRPTFALASLLQQATTDEEIQSSLACSETSVVGLALWSWPNMRICAASVSFLALAKSRFCESLRVVLHSANVIIEALDFYEASLTKGTFQSQRENITEEIADILHRLTFLSTRSEAANQLASLLEQSVISRITRKPLEHLKQFYPKPGQSSQDYVVKDPVNTDLKFDQSKLDTLLRDPTNSDLYPNSDQTTQDCLSGEQSDPNSLYLITGVYCSWCISKVYSVSPSTYILEHLASINQWLMVLVLNQIFSYPPDIFSKVLLKFQSVSIQQHLSLCFKLFKDKNSENTEKPSQDRSKTVEFKKPKHKLRKKKSENINKHNQISPKQKIQPNKNLESETCSTNFSSTIFNPDKWESDVLSVIWECHKSKTPASDLIEASVSLKSPILAAVACCYDESLHLTCLKAYLYGYINSNSDLYNRNGEKCIPVPMSFEELNSSNFFNEILTFYFKNNLADTLLEGFEVFLRANPSLALLKFLVMAKSGESLEGLKELLQNNSPDRFEDHKSIFCNVLVTGIDLYLDNRYLQKLFIEDFMKILPCFQFSSGVYEVDIDFIVIHELLNIACEHEVPLDMFRFSDCLNSSSLSLVSRKLITFLGEKKLFDEASRIASLMKFEDFDILYLQLKSNFYKVIERSVEIKSIRAFLLDTHLTFIEKNHQPFKVAEFYKELAKLAPSSLISYLILQYAVCWSYLCEETVTEKCSSNLLNKVTEKCSSNLLNKVTEIFKDENNSQDKVTEIVKVEDNLLSKATEIVKVEDNLQDKVTEMVKVNDWNVGNPNDLNTTTRIKENQSLSVQERHKSTRFKDYNKSNSKIDSEEQTSGQDTTEVTESNLEKPGYSYRENLELEMWMYYFSHCLNHDFDSSYLMPLGAFKQWPWEVSDTSDFLVYKDMNKLSKIVSLKSDLNEKFQIFCRIHSKIEDDLSILPDFKRVIGHLIQYFLDKSLLITSCRIQNLFGLCNDVEIIESMLKLACEWKPMKESSDNPLDESLTLSESNIQTKRDDSFPSLECKGSSNLNVQFDESSKSNDLSNSVTNFSKNESFHSLNFNLSKYNTKTKLLEDLKSLSKGLSSGHKLSHTIIVLCTIAEELSTSYLDIIRYNDPFHILLELLSRENLLYFQLAKKFIRAISLDDKLVASFLVLEFVSFVSSTEKSQSLIFKDEDFEFKWKQLITLVESPSDIGHLILKEFSSLFKSSLVKTLSSCVELLIGAHECFCSAVNTEGVYLVLHESREISQELVKYQHWTLLGRLLTGIKRYSDMSYVIDILKQQGQLQSLLGSEELLKNRKQGLDTTLVYFLQSKYPEDKELRKLVAHHCGMFLELAKMWIEEAEELVDKVVQESTVIVSPETSTGSYFGNFFKSKSQTGKNKESEDIAYLNNPDASSLIQAIQCYSKAAKYAIQQEQQANAIRYTQQAELIAVQLVRIKETKDDLPLKILKLTPQYLKFLSSRFLNVREIIVIHKAYARTPDWPDFIYQRYICEGEETFIQEFIKFSVMSNSVVLEILNKIERNGLQSQQKQRITKILNYVSNIDMVYKFASQLGLKNVLQNCLDSNATCYLKDTVFSKGIVGSYN